MTLLDTLTPRATDDSPLPHEAAPPRAPKVRLITSEQLFADFPEVQIMHGEAIYRLRQTSLGKLILTK